MTKLLFIDNGIEFDSRLIREKAFGGAEIAFVSLVEELAKLNFEVKVFNNCVNQGTINNVKWEKIDERINFEKFDVLVVNRGDKYLNFRKECKKRIFWIHNPANYLLKYRYLSKLFLNKFTIVFSSFFHEKTYPIWAPAKKRIVIPYGVDNFLFKKKKVKNSPKPKAIFTSNPLRGLEWLLDQWEFKIFPKVNNAKLDLYSGPTTYGKFGQKHSKKMWEVLKRAKSLVSKGVNLMEPINRRDLFKKIQESRVFLYRGTDDETFCMSLAESQMLGVPAVVCNFGCMSERIIQNKTGFICENDEEFCNNTINLLLYDNVWERMHKKLIKSPYHKKWEDIAKEWKQILQ